MGDRVMEPAEQLSIIQVGGSSVGPVTDMVAFAVLGTPAAAAGRAAPVPVGDRPAERRRKRPTRAAHI
jgi:hypothetical protein